MSQPIVIVGAGVLGLSTAAVLQERHPSLRITMVAAEMPLVPPFIEAPRPSPDYASMWAGAHFRPDFRDDDNAVAADEHKMALHTAGVMSKLAQQFPESGVMRITGREIEESMPGATKAAKKTGDEYAAADGSDAFRLLDDQELAKAGASAVWGCEYRTWVVNVHIYCRWLLTQFVRRGGLLVQRRLAKLEDAFDIVAGNPLVINCSGRNFDTDPACHVIRGQTVLVGNFYNKTTSRRIVAPGNDKTKKDEWSFLIPRPLGGGTIVGGTKQMDDWDTQIRPEETRHILANVARCWPGFVARVEDFEVLAVNVGLRPYREGGMRIEREVLGQGPGLSPKTVIHGYGAGARGYELGWGAAERIARLAEEELKLVARL